MKEIRKVIKNNNEYQFTDINAQASIDTIVDELNNLEIPDKTSDLENDSGFLNSSNLKTINHQSIVGSGNIDIQGGGSGNIISLTKEEYDALEEKDPNTIYNITDATDIDVYTKEEIDEMLDEIQLYKFPNVTIFGQPTIQNGQVSNFSNDNYLQFPFLVDFQNRPFNIYFSFTTPSNLSGQQNILDSNFGLAFAIRDGKVVAVASDNGTSWTTGELISTQSLTPNTTYYFKISWVRGTENPFLSIVGGLSKDDNLISMGVITEPPYPKTMVIGRSYVNNGNYFKGSINLNDASLEISEKVVWQGMDDVGLATRASVDLSNIDDKGKEVIDDRIDAKIANKQDTLVSGTNIKTINGQTILGSGNITIQGGGGVSGDYLPLSGGTLTGKIQIGDSTSNIPNAILHVRSVSSSITGSKVNGACYSVNGDGTASLQHKTYNDDGSGAKNSAVLRMSNQGLQFAINTGTTSTPSEDMYKEIATQDYVDGKQDKLTAGEGIYITDNVISTKPYTTTADTYVAWCDGNGNWAVDYTAKSVTASNPTAIECVVGKGIQKLNLSNSQLLNKIKIEDDSILDYLIIGYGTNCYSVNSDINGVCDLRNCNKLITLKLNSNSNSNGVGFKGNTLYLPNSITSIGTAAFAYCSITTLLIPNSITTIGKNAFYNVPSAGTLYCDEDWFNNLDATSKGYLYNVANWERKPLPKSIEERVDNLESTIGNINTLLENIIGG